MHTFPPNLLPTQCDWRLVSRTQVFQSPFGGSAQTLELPGAYWQARLTFANLNREQGARLHAFVQQLRGASGRVALWDHAFATPRGPVFGTPVVNGANQRGNRLNVAGLQANTPFLSVGDYCGIDGQLVILTEAASADQQGRATLVFEPPLRRAPPSGAPIVTTRPTARMRLKDDNQGGRRSTKRRVLSSMTLTFVEDTV
ncbi:hypothetical protein [Ferrimonas balearica]|uniref:hypothetical protein n=1 Tax=Ferrimonas balearica TaxID=44012 RepID=UPI001C94B8C8|nr:hypothetical protein [Ferrimonas balearica]MBY6223554.1 hypothetical protein [Ferrimonas balearica]